MVQALRIVPAGLTSDVGGGLRGQGPDYSRRASGTVPATAGMSSEMMKAIDVARRLGRG